jgi:hypothetical protein
MAVSFVFRFFVILSRQNATFPFFFIKKVEARNTHITLNKSNNNEALSTNEYHSRLAHFSYSHHGLLVDPGTHCQLLGLW